MTALQITPRPYTSPCAQCSGEIPEELNTAAFAQADDPTKTVCDACAKRTAPDAYQALYDLRRIDTQFWAIWNRDGDPDGPESPQSHAEAPGRENARDDGPEPGSVALVPAVTASGGFGDGNPHAKAAEQ